MLSVDFCLDFLGRENLLHFALFVDEPGGAQSAHALAAAHGLLAPCTKLLEHRGVGVGNEREGKLIFVDELLVAGGRILADAYNGVAGILQLLIVFL